MQPVSDFYRGYEVEAVPIGDRWRAKFYASRLGLPLQPTSGLRPAQRFDSAGGALHAARQWVDELLAEVDQASNTNRPRC